MNLLIAFLLGVGLHAPQQENFRVEPWPEGIVEVTESLPIQDGGRIKPLHTFASFTLLRLNGKRSVETPAGERLTPVEWLLDSLFFPAAAANYRVFLVQNSEVVEAIGVSVADKKKRDRYTFNELQPGIQRLFSLAHEYAGIEDKDRSSVQQQVVVLAENVNSYLPIFTGVQSFAMIPPAATVEEEAEWFTPGELLERSDEQEALPAAHADILQRLRTIVAYRSDFDALERELTAVHSGIRGLASARGEYGKIDMEVSYYELKLISRSLYLFVFAFLAMAFLWLRPKSKLPYVTTATGVVLATGLLITGIVMRCLIRDRPPVSTLYETVLFVTAVGALVALFMEMVNRQRIALSAAAILGMVGLFVANGYEMLDKQDTMPSLVAVLDTNFWLATHVTAITTGYSAGMLAALLASIYIVAKAVRWKREDRAFYRNLSRMVYGVVCFALIFALVGTILGGIWANDSWGRFWGWDPKENGALLIVISQILILHARMAGILRELGICMATAFGGTVIAFSWWGVNLLGVGLHSYGFTSGIHTGLWTYYGFQWGIVLLGAATWWRENRASASEGQEAPEAKTLPTRKQAA